jgi:hypothetical protein
VKDDRVYLQHIRDALNDITNYCGSGRERFFSDHMRQDATLRGRCEEAKSRHAAVSAGLWLGTLIFGLALIRRVASGNCA